MPIRIINVPVNAAVLELSLHAYDASYLSLAVYGSLPIATSDDKLAAAAQNAGVHVLRP